MKDLPFTLNLHYDRDHIWELFSKGGPLSNYYDRKKLEVLGISLALIFLSTLVYYFRGLSYDLILFIGVVIIPLGSYYFSKAIDDLHNFLKHRRFVHAYLLDYEKSSHGQITLLKDHFLIEKDTPFVRGLYHYRDVRRIVHAIDYVLLELKENETIFLTRRTFVEQEQFEDFCSLLIELKRKKSNMKYNFEEE